MSIDEIIQYCQAMIALLREQRDKLHGAACDYTIGKIEGYKAIAIMGMTDLADLGVHIMTACYDRNNIHQQSAKDAQSGFIAAYQDIHWLVNA